MPTTVLTTRDLVKGSDTVKNGVVCFIDCWLAVGFSGNSEVLHRTRPEREPTTAACCSDLLQGLLRSIRDRICKV